MLNNNLFEEVLIEPVKQGCDELKIVSGYATSAMAFHHLNQLNEYNFAVDLVIGMCSLEGISLSNHQGFIDLIQSKFCGRLACKYRREFPPVHTKLYVWLKNKEPMVAYMGSANYTQTAFNSKRQLEALTVTPEKPALDYFSEIERTSISCTNRQAADILSKYNNELKTRYIKTTGFKDIIAKGTQKKIQTIGLKSIDISFLAKNGTLPARSGLNWGQRPEQRREPNQAYIRLTSSVYSSDFFPKVGVYFTVLTDDDITIICSRAQANGKAIHTPYDNSIIGKYFRKRLGLQDGSFVELKHLKKYGRTDVTFFKIDDETYFMDFSV